MDSAIHQINHYIIQWIEIYQVDSVIYLLHNWHLISSSA